jgi:hypothetical protein
MKRILALVVLAAGLGLAWGLMWGAALSSPCAPAQRLLAAAL